MEGQQEQKPSRGAIWIATGTKYINAAIKSAQSLKEHCGADFQTHIFTDNVEQATSSGAFNSTSLIENPHRRSKVDYMALSPYDQVLLLKMGSIF